MILKLHRRFLCGEKALKLLITFLSAKQLMSDEVYKVFLNCFISASRIQHLTLKC
jgi:hypothetical protein